MKFIKELLVGLIQWISITIIIGTIAGVFNWLGGGEFLYAFHIWATIFCPIYGLLLLLNYANKRDIL